ncbi:MAG: hypothetical protein HC888_17675 [Candidatus Competibacteraceae bacterium]|nr:hypothetical protein [Candidatus Competibacteraceae bacterium]
MAIEYTLYFDSNRPALELHQVICICVGERPATTLSDVYPFSGLGLQGAVLVPDELTREFVREDFSVNPRVQVNFRLDKFNLMSAQDSLARCISALATADAGDMILLFNGEMVVLQRREGDLLLREGFGVWTPERILLFTTPHRIGSIS